MRKSLRSEVNSTPLKTEHGSSLKAAARKLIGSTVKKDRTKSYTGKVGFAVGMKRGAMIKRLSRSTSTSKGSVGVAGANIHWFVLGTSERTTKSGKSTGKVPPLLLGVTKRASSSALSAAARAAKIKMIQVISNEARRR